jgi:hypothetical protein
LPMTASTTSGRKRVMGPQLMFGWESSITRTSVLPDRWHPTMNIGLSMVLSPPRAAARRCSSGNEHTAPGAAYWVRGLGWRLGRLLLIGEVVAPPNQPGGQAMDLPMAAVGGQERIEQGWRALLADTGFVLAGIRPFHSGSILKAVPTPSQTPAARSGALNHGVARVCPPRPLGWVERPGWRSARSSSTVLVRVVLVRFVDASSCRQLVVG